MCAARTSASCAGILIRLAPWLRLRAPAAGRPVRQPLSVGATRRGGGRRRCAASVPELGAPRLHQLLRPAALRHFCRPHARHRPRYPARGLRGGCGWSSALLLSLVTLPMLACSIVSFFPRLCPAWFVRGSTLAGLLLLLFACEYGIAVRVRMRVRAHASVLRLLPRDALSRAAQHPRTRPPCCKGLRGAARGRAFPTGCERCGGRRLMMG